MTYSIVARCPRTGEYGVGNRHLLAQCRGALPGGGAAAWRRLDAGRGQPPPAADRAASDGLGAVGRESGGRAARLRSVPAVAQIHVVDVYGRAHAFTGEKNPGWAGHRVGDGYSVAGNVLAGEGVVLAMAAAFEASADEPLAERLVRAVEAGRDAGGQPEGQNSSALMVYGDQSFPLVDLRVDLHDQPRLNCAACGLVQADGALLRAARHHAQRAALVAVAHGPCAGLGGAAPGPPGLSARPPRLVDRRHRVLADRSAPAPGSAG